MVASLLIVRVSAEAAEMLVSWHDNEITPIEVWVGSGDQYASARDNFVNGELVFFMSGSWQIQGFNDTIGDQFDWQAVPNPSGPGGSTGIPGGAVMAAMNTTAPSCRSCYVDGLSCTTRCFR